MAERLVRPAPPEVAPPEIEKDEEIRLSVVLPSFRDAPRLAAHVPTLQRYLREREISHEIVVCDDGSDDGGLTREVCDTLGCVYLPLPRNRGKGAALRLGMRAARGRFRLFTDADVPYELDVIERALHYLDFKEFHMVAGDRTLESSRYFHEVPRWRRIGSSLCSFFVGRFVAGGWYDTQCGLKGFRAEVAEDLFGVSRIDRFAIDVELFYVALKRNYDIKRLPVELRWQEGSSVRLVRDGLAMMRDVLRVFANHKLGRYASRRAALAREAGSTSMAEREGS